MICMAACGGSDQTSGSAATVADDVLFLVLGKMSLYDQSASGDISLRNHHFVAEIMPKAGRRIVSGSLHSTADDSQVLEFAPEGNAFLAHGARESDPERLHQIHPDGKYVFTYETQSGRMDAQPLTLRRRSTVPSMPAAAKVSLLQKNTLAAPPNIDPDEDLIIGWEPMPGNTKVSSSDLADLVFVLVFDCFGNNIAHSGRPYQGGSYLTYADTDFTVAASALQPGLRYTAIVEQATADVDIFRNVPAIATYATLTFVKFQTSGQPQENSCAE